MSKIGILVVSVLCASIAPHAAADWRSTKWSMTPEQVLGADEGEVVATDDHYTYGVYKGEIPFAIIENKKIGANEYLVIFNRDESGAFVSVLLRTEAALYARIKRELIAAYGKPDVDEGGVLPKAQWTDRDGGNVITLSQISRTYIEYRPIPADGL